MEATDKNNENKENKIKFKGFKKGKKLKKEDFDKAYQKMLKETVKIMNIKNSMYYTTENGNKADKPKYVEYRCRRFRNQEEITSRGNNLRPTQRNHHNSFPAVTLVNHALRQDNYTKTRCYMTHNDEVRKELYEHDSRIRKLDEEPAKQAGAKVARVAEVLQEK